MIVRWPGKIKANSSSELLCANYDFMATFSELMETEAPQGKDGISLLPTLLASGKQIEHESVFVGNNALITKDSWKLVHHEKNITCSISRMTQVSATINAAQPLTNGHSVIVNTI